MDTCLDADKEGQRDPPSAKTKRVEFTRPSRKNRSTLTGGEVREPSKESLRFFHSWMLTEDCEAKTWPVENIRDIARMLDAKDAEIATLTADNARLVAEMGNCEGALLHVRLALGLDCDSNDNLLDVIAASSTRAAGEAERIRICAYLGYDTTYSDEFCVRCSHCPSNCECAEPVYMAGWEPDETLRAFKVALFQEVPPAFYAREDGIREAAAVVCNFCAQGIATEFTCETYLHHLEGETPWVVCRADKILALLTPPEQPKEK